MNSNNWEEEIREKLGSYSTVDLDGLWERVESAAGSRKPAFILWNKVMVSMASIAAAAIITLFLWHGGDSPDREMVQDGLTPWYTAELKADKDESINEKQTYTIENASSPVENGAATREQRGKPAVAEAISVDVAGADEPRLDLFQNAAEHVEQEPMAGRGSEEPEYSNMAFEKTWQEFEKTIEKTRKKRRVTLYADGGSAVTSASNTAPAIRLKSGMTLLNSINSFSFLNSTPYRKNIFEAPASNYSWTVSARSTLRIEMGLTDRLGLSSGVSWTLLQGTDDFKVFRPTLQYIGVPIYLSAGLVEYGPLAVKAVCGPRLDILIKGNEDIVTGPMLLSAHGGLQAVYMFNRNLGLSAGGGADLYFPTSGIKSPFASATPVANVDFGLLFRM